LFIVFIGDTIILWIKSASQSGASIMTEYQYSSFNRPVLEACPPYGYLRCEASTEHPYGILVYSTKLVQAAMNQYELYPVSDNAYAYAVGSIVWYEGIDKCRVTEHVGRGRYMLELVDDTSLIHEYVSPKSLEMYTDLTPTCPVKDDDYAFDPIDAPEMMSTELDPSEIETPDPCPKCGAPLSYYSTVRFIECTNRTCGYNSHNQEKSISTAPQMTHEQIKAHNSDALFNEHPQDFIGYDDDTGEGETVSETLERAEACIALIELAIKKQATYGDLTSTYIEKQCADLRLILGTL
jgi:ssDNA-binding Zn-finger/Zn-ribbon topoisomerase 1